MDTSERAVLEEQLQSLWSAGEYQRAATLAVRGYGPEILGFLVALHRDHNDASDVFSEFCEDLWRGLPRFEGRASFRTWLYVLARHASHRFHKHANRRRKMLHLSECTGIERLEARVRTATLSFMRSQARTRLHTLRESLPPDDQALLILRVDKNLDWNELAQVFHDGDTIEHAELVRESARLRKRYQLLKERLRELMRADRPAQ
jgi:RNA polymerase sigma-70 factor (ECF subfamily)